MKLHLTEAQLLHEWQLRYFPGQVNSGCIVTTHSGYDFEAIIRARMLDWYGRLLAEGPEEFLAPVDIGGRLNVTLDTEGVGHVILPETVVRLTGVEMEGWSRPAIIVTDLESPEAHRQCSPYSRGGTVRPVAVVDGRSLTLYTPAAAGCRLSVTAVIDDADTFHLDSAALSAIQPFYPPVS